MTEAFRIFPENKDEWNQLLFNSINCSYIASLEYAYTKTYRGKIIESFLFRDNGKVVAGAHYSVRRSYINLISVADVQSGYIFRDTPDEGLLDFLADHFEAWARSANASYVRIYPGLHLTAGDNKNITAGIFDVLLRKKGYKIIEQGQHTYWLDLTKTEDELLKNMKRQTRYEIVHAKDLQLTVSRHDEPSEEAFEAFWKLYNTLGQEKGFGTLEKGQFREEIFSLMGAGFANLFMLLYNDRVINIAFASNLGRASYMYGAMDPQFKQIPGCPSPGQFAQWEMIRYMKSRDVKIYDLGYCPGPVPYQGHPQYSIWRFKYGFGGDHVQFLPVYGKILKPLRGKLFHLLRYSS
jgi:lipid II:glycine glycyltransferase (peptidoglycan interpeptide bridge formation enzyme)